MKPAAFTYHDPKTSNEVIELLSQHEDAKILAGGQSLIPMLNMRFVVPDHVIDINGVKDLDSVFDNGESLEIGAMTRQSNLSKSHDVKTKTPIFLEALGNVGHFQTRNRGTLGGSLCHLDPAAEIPCLMAAYDAVMIAQGPNGLREIPFSEWPLAYMMPSLEPDELLIKVRVPYWRSHHGYSFVEFARRHGDFAIIAVAVLIEMDGKTISRASISVGGADIRPIRLFEAEEGLIGENLDVRVFKSAAEIARKVDAMSDAYVTSSYRQRLAATLVERALVQAAERVSRGENNA